MQIVLLKDVPHVGKKWEVKNVRGGYARNFLIPQGSAAPARPADLPDIARRSASAAEAAATARTALCDAIAALAGKTVTIVRKAGEKGQLFAGVGAEDIAEALSAESGAHVPAQSVRLSSPIKQTGMHEVSIAASQDDEAHTVAIKVEAEENRDL